MHRPGGFKVEYLSVSMSTTEYSFCLCSSTLSSRYANAVAGCFCSSAAGGTGEAGGLRAWRKRGEQHTWCAATIRALSVIGAGGWQWTQQDSGLSEQTEEYQSVHIVNKACVWQEM